MKIKRVPGSNIKISLQSFEYLFRFVISNTRLDWNYFNISSWKLKKVRNINNCFLFCYRNDYDKVLISIDKEDRLIRCINCLSKISGSANDLGATITCYYQIGKSSLILPNFEWWKYNELTEEFEAINAWYEEYFMAK